MPESLKLFSKGNNLDIKLRSYVIYGKAYCIDIFITK